MHTSIYISNKEVVTYIVPALAFLKEKERETIRKRERVTMPIIMCVQPMCLFTDCELWQRHVAAGEV